MSIPGSRLAMDPLAQNALVVGRNHVRQEIFVAGSLNKTFQPVTPTDMRSNRRLDIDSGRRFRLGHDRADAFARRLGTEQMLHPGKPLQHDPSSRGFIYVFLYSQPDLEFSFYTGFDEIVFSTTRPGMPAFAGVDPKGVAGCRSRRSGRHPQLPGQIRAIRVRKWPARAPRPDGPAPPARLRHQHAPGPAGYAFARHGR